MSHEKFEHENNKRSSTFVQFGHLSCSILLQGEKPQDVTQSLIEESRGKLDMHSFYTRLIPGAQ